MRARAARQRRWMCAPRAPRGTPPAAALPGRPGTCLNQPAIPKLHTLLACDSLMGSTPRHARHHCGVRCTGRLAHSRAGRATAQRATCCKGWAGSWSLASVVSASGSQKATGFAPGHGVLVWPPRRVIACPGQGGSYPATACWCGQPGAQVVGGQACPRHIDAQDRD